MRTMSLKSMLSIAPNAKRDPPPDSPISSQAPLSAGIWIFCRKIMFLMSMFSALISEDGVQASPPCAPCP